MLAAGRKPFIFVFDGCSIAETQSVFGDRFADNNSIGGWSVLESLPPL